jgi:hypothetical protein
VAETSLASKNEHHPPLLRRKAAALEKKVLLRSKQDLSSVSDAISLVTAMTFFPYLEFFLPWHVGR